MELLVEVLDRAQTVAFVVVGLWAVRTWRRRRDEASRWLAVSFGSLALIVAIGLALELTEHLLAVSAVDLIGRGQFALLVAFPYLLLRFLDTFEPVSRGGQAVVGVVVALLAAAGMVVTFPEPTDPWTLAFTAFATGVVGTYVVVMPFVAWRFWRAGRDQPTLARRRLRLIGAAVVTLSIVIVLLAASTTAEDAVEVATPVTGVTAALLLLVGFAPPRWLRLLWRRPEEQALHTAALQLLAAVDARDVAAVLTPHLRLLVAARGVALLHRDRFVGADGVSIPEGTARDVEGLAGAIRQPLAEGAILVWTDRYTPFFGAEELQLLERTGLLADLALQRADLLAREQAAKRHLADTNAELEAFVYSASHDLKSPLIAMLSYVDLLVADHRDRLDDEAQWFLDRLVTNGRYMEALIGDLLELSRVGRTMLTPERVELDGLVAELATELTGAHPDVQIVASELPVLWVNGTRMRQLLQNLLENAAKHGHHGVRIEVGAEPTDDGGVELRVRDDGPGIPRPYRERVFGVFERLEVQDATSGTGIGLAICRKVVESLGGRIWLAERDDGAEFRIALPPAVLVEHVVPTEEVPA